MNISSSFVTYERPPRPMCRLEVLRREKHLRKPVDRERPLHVKICHGPELKRHWSNSADRRTLTDLRRAPTL